MAEAHDNNYVVGKGKLLFNRFLDNTKTPTGERYLGNTPGFSLSQAEESLDHYDADGGLRVKDASVTLSQDTSGTITADDISDENVALWWLGDVAPITIVGSDTPVVETFGHVMRGTHIQLGATVSNPQGTGHLTSVDSITVDGDAVLAPTNWEADLSAGSIYILPNAPDIPSGSEVVVTYKQGAHTSTVVIAKGRSIYGSLRFIATNPVGKRRHGFFPYVKLAPDGDYALKGEDWQSFDFALDILKLDSVTERVYWYT